MTRGPHGCSALLLLAAAADAPTADPGGSTRPAPIREFADAQGRACRVYERRIVIAGEVETAYATVCREPNGRWVLSR